MTLGREKMRKLIRAIVLSTVLLTGLSFNSYVSAESDIEAGILKATQLIEMNPNGSNYLLRATMYSHNQNFELAILDCNKALELGFNDDQVYEVRAMSYLNLEKVEEAIADCDHIIANNSKNAAAYKIRAGAYVLKNDYDAALADCRSAIALDPNDEDLKSRINDIEQLKATRDSDPQAKEQDLFNMGFNYFKAQKFDEAIKNFTKVLEINPKNITALKIRGAAYATINDFDKAISDWEKVIELNPDDTTVKDWLNKAHEAQNAK